MADMERLEQLYIWVTNTIHYLDCMEDKKSKAARGVYCHLSAIEEEIADLVPESEPEGKIARRGAVRAAVNSGDTKRALYLAASFIAAGTDQVLATELEELVTSA